MERKEFKTNKGNHLIQIGKSSCEYQDKIFFVYEHTNGTEYWTRIIPATFLMYINYQSIMGKEDLCLIKREDCKGNSRVLISKVYINLKGGRHSSQP